MKTFFSLSPQILIRFTKRIETTEQVLTCKQLAIDNATADGLKKKAIAFAYDLVVVLGQKGYVWIGYGSQVRS
jgi:hypothetical protein